MLKSLRDINADTTAAAVSSTAETAATAAAAAAAANIPTMKRLQVGSAELMDAASKKKLELEEKKKREQEAHDALKQPFPNAMRDWSIDDVLRWLDVLSLSQYKQAFKEGAVDGALLLELRPEDLADILGVTHKAHILKLLVSRKKYLPLSAQEKMKVTAVESEETSGNARKGVPDMETAFSQARNGRLKRLMESVEAGFDVNAEDDKGNTLLLTAAQNMNQKMVEYLILKGSNINHKNAQGNTALHFAMAYDKEGVF
jgi:broad specificity phosphatase PhoE